MKIIQPNHKNLDLDIKEKLQSNADFHNSKTNFLISLLFLICEGIIPWLILYLLTSHDVVFKIVTLNVGAGIGYSFLVLIGSLLLTIFTYFFHLHEHDQIIYNFTLGMCFMGLYLSGYWWDEASHHLLYRSLVALGFLLFGAMFGTMIGLSVKNMFGLLLAKRTGDNSNIVDSIVEDEELNKNTVKNEKTDL